MKKFMFAAFIAFWSSVATLLAVQAMSPETGLDGADGELPEFTLADVAKHNTLASCWMAIEGKVYDFTDYIPKHPTPPFVMEQWCGREATEGMRTKGYGPDHTPAAWAMMEPYLIGVLAD
ncbi:MAG: cytochrome b5 domain-containing protein [Wenzhouxiangellaceae bacterium]|nr:MAG: cytochrome b5 domain-containing protein [Wenzhouxiangellaceae bacterium]